MNTQTSLFLSQTYEDAWDDYMRSLTHPGFARWDYVILTASNEHQAEGYRAQLAERERAGFLPPQTHFAVLADEGGVRVGSGGATLGVLRYIAEQTGKTDFSGLRILTIHSGGDSKRIPQYSALGKLFSPVPHELPNGRASAVFDELMIAYSNVPSRIRDGMLLLSGDILLLFNSLQIDYSGEGAAAISVKEKVETGKEHGVYLRGENGEVARFLHKQPVEVLRGCGAVNGQDCVDIDTGAVIFSAKMLDALYGLVLREGRLSEELYRGYVNDRVRLSLYADFLYPLASESTLEAFYREKPEGEYTEELRAARTEVWRVLRPFRMKLVRLAPAKFIHFGTTEEIMRLFAEEIGEYRYLKWSKHANSSIADESVAGYNSIMSKRASCGAGSYLEASYVHAGAEIGENALVSYVDIERGVRVPDDVVLHGLKQRDGKFVARIYGIGDNPKQGLGSGGTLFGRPLAEFMERSGIDEREVWEGRERTLWTAKLYPACGTIEEAVAAALNVYEMGHGGGEAASWRRAERKSMLSGFSEADPEALLAWNKRMDELVRMDRIAKMIREGRAATGAREVLCTKRLTKIQREWLQERLSGAELWERMRLHYYVGSALGGAEGEKEIYESLRCLQEAIVEDAEARMKAQPARRIVREKQVERLPLRVNWGGTWSDTPPYCIERGGTMVNAAILLNGREPVEVTLTRLDERKIVIVSEDTDAYGEFKEIGALQRTGDPFDPFALQKAALLASGIIPKKGGELGEILSELGGGFRMETEVTGVPKGSGLGTSSILAGACMKALYEFTGVAYTQQDLYRSVLAIEQIMTTGGGWQDQVGGLSRGIKYSRTKPGVHQVIEVEPIAVPEEAMRELNERFALIYTGQRRLARNLLREIVGHYIGNEPSALEALNEVQKVAALERFELARGNIDGLAEQLNRHWELSKQIDEGSTNTVIEQIFASIEDMIDGRMICGAGGGGFLQVIMKKGVRREDLHERLGNVFQDSDVDVWDCTLV